MGLTSLTVQLLVILLLFIFYFGYRMFRRRESTAAHLRAIQPLQQQTPEPEEASSVPTISVRSQMSMDIAALPEVGITLEPDTEIASYTTLTGKLGHQSRPCASARGGRIVTPRSINYGARSAINWCPNCSRLMTNRYGPKTTVKAPPTPKPKVRP